MNRSLTEQEEEVWVEQNLNPGGHNLNCFFTYEIMGKLDVARFAESIKDLCNLHTTLRAGFSHENNQVQKITFPEFETSPCEYIDLSNKNNSIKKAKKLIEEKEQTVFDLEKPPIAFCLVKFDSNRFYFTMVQHHIIVDGQSEIKFTQDLSHIYQKRKLPKKNTIESADKTKPNNTESWEDILKDRTLEFNFNKSAPDRYLAKLKYFKLSEHQHKLIKSLCKKNHTTPFIFIMSIYSILLERYFGNEEFFIFYPKDIRKKGKRDKTGFFVMQLPIHINLKKNNTLEEVLNSVTAQVKLAKKNNPLTMGQYIKLSGKPQTRNENILSVTQTMLYNDTLYLGEQITTKFIHSGIGSPKKQLSLLLDNSQPEMLLGINYNKALFQEAFIMQFVSHFNEIIEQVLKTPDIHLNLLKLRKRYKQHGEKKPKTEVSNKSVYQLFDDQVNNAPNNLAMTSKNSTYSFLELRCKVESLAEMMHQFDLKKQSIIAVCVSSRSDFITSYLAISRLNHIYVPIDMQQPEERILQILSDAKPGLILTNENTKEMNWGTIKTPKLEIEKLHPKKHLTPYETDPTNINYIIYTSGTTGKPKGVMINEKAASDFAQTQIQEIPYTSDTRVSQLLSPSFDASLGEVLPTLISGSTICTYPEEKLDVYKINEFISEYKINILTISADILPYIDRSHSHLQYIIYGGSTAANKDLNELSKQYQMINEYGPTETTICATKHFFKLGDDPRNIGLANANIKCYVLDKKLRKVPNAVIGELYIGGSGVSDGYLAMPELTIKKFIKNPFRSHTKYPILYKTGDLVMRSLKSDELIFIGRKDHQVKIRGFRIELGEIESAVESHPNISQASVIVKKNITTEAKVLAVFYTGTKEIVTDDLKKFLEKSIPQYMIPSFYLQIEEMPLTNNGKIDEKTLDQLPIETLPKESGYTAPENNMESKLCDVWTNILGIKKISINDDLYSLGASSLTLINLTNAVNKEFQLSLTPQALDKSRSIRKLAQSIEKINLKTQNLTLKKIKPRTYHSATFSQKSQYILHKMENENVGHYNLPALFLMNDNLSTSTLNDAWKSLISRHSSLRSVFSTSKKTGAVLFRILKPNELSYKIEEHDFKQKTLAESEDIFSRILNKRFNSLSKAPLWRLYKLTNFKGNPYFLIVFHHIIADGESISILKNELNTLLNNKSLEKLSYDFESYSNYQNESINEGELKQQENYWLNKLSSTPDPLELPRDFPKKDVRSYEGKRINCFMKTDLLNKIKCFTKKNNITISTLILSCFSLLLSRYSQNKRFTIGLPVSGRSLPETQSLVGMFVNTLPLLINIDEKNSVKSLFESTHEEVISTLENQNYPFELLIEKLKLSFDSSDTPVFSVLFDIVDFRNQANEDLPLQFSDDALNYYSIAKFDLSLDVTLTSKNGEDHASLSIEYASTLFKETTINSMMERLLNLIDQIVLLSSTNENLANIRDLSQADIQKIISYSTGAIRNYQPKTLIERFEIAAANHPDNIALSFNQTTYTYKTVNQLANQLAHEILRHKDNSTPDQRRPLVALFLERGPTNIIAMIATMKARMAYIPIDVTYPSKRIKHILSTGQPKFFLSDTHTIKKQPELEQSEKTILIDQLDPKGLSAANLDFNYSEADLAYVIFTSGSTGKPKGVMVKQKGLSNLASWYVNEFSISASDKSSQIASQAFDTSGCEIWPFMAVGATLCITPNETRKDPKKLCRWLIENQITFSDMPTVLAKLVLNEPEVVNTNLNYLKIGGEKASQLSTPNNISFKLVNTYGPTENTIESTFYIFDPKDEPTPAIGKPIQNVSAYILNSQLNLVPDNVIGEIYLAGDGLAEGYLNNDTTTNSSFISSEHLPTATKNLLPENITQLYKTGDLAKWRSDGCIDYIGRTDSQIKIRGYRIELPEIEKTLEEHSDIKSCVIVADTNNDSKNTRLIAYYTATKKIESAQLKQFVSNALPDYMRPHFYMHIDSIPTTINGKTDYKALPTVDLEALANESYIPPADELEKALASIWKEILNLPKVGAVDNFFELGGNSLLATQLCARVLEKFKTPLSLSSIFKNTTIQLQANIIKHHRPNEKSLYLLPIKNTNPNKIKPSFQQQMILNYLRHKPDSTLYQSGMAIPINKKIDIKKLESSFKYLFKKYSLLRLIISLKNDSFSLALHDKDQIPFTIEDISQRNIKNIALYVDQEKIKLSEQPYIFGQDYLYRFKLIKISEDAHYLIVCFSRLMTDGYSFAMLMKNLFGHYDNNEKLLTESNYQYYDYADWQHEAQNEGLFNNALNYWKSQYKTLPAHSLLKPDQDEIRTLNGLCNCIKIDLSAQQTQNLREFSKKTNISVYTLFFAYWAQYLKQKSGESDFTILCIYRNRYKKEFEMIHGPFTDYLPIRLDISDKISHLDIIKHVDHKIKKGLDHTCPYTEILKELPYTEEEKLRYCNFPLAQTSVNFPMPFDVNAKDFINLLPDFRFDENKNHTSETDISLEISEGPEYFGISLHYRHELFTDEAAQGILNEFSDLFKNTLEIK